MKKAAENKTEFYLTDIGEGIVEVEVLKWYVKPGDTVKAFDKLLEVQSDKATVEITSRFDGVVKTLAVGEQEMATVGQVLVYFEGSKVDPSSSPETDDTETDGTSLPVSDTSTEATEPSHVDNSELNAFGGGGKKFLSTPAVRHLAREHGVDLSLIKGVSLFNIFGFGLRRTI
jgi:2-oxoisovalerate dehydrogenase E2 component (dihydrolipoyl transacylase)